MRYLLLIIFTVSCMSCSEAQIESLENFKWKNRLLIIYFNSENLSQHKNQIATINQATEEYEERDLKVIILQNQKAEIWDSEKSNQLEYSEIIQKLNIDSSESYQNLLIGKDGGVKLRSDTPIANEKIFKTIDAMPMRQREMRDQY